jgi:hypothetical protein
VTDTTWLTITVLAQDASILVAFVMFLLNQRNGKREFLLLGLLLFISLIADITGIIGAMIYRKNMNAIYSVFYLFFLPIFLLFYRSKIRSRQIGTLLNVVIILFLAFGVINFIFIQKTAINSYTRSFATISMIAVSITYFYVLIKELPTETITRLPMFWINTAVLIYYSGTFFQYLATDYLVNVLNDNLINTWTLKNFLGIIYYCILSFALWLNRSNLLQDTSARSN